MDRYDLHKLQMEYFSHSQYSPPAPTPSDYLVDGVAGYGLLNEEKPFLDLALQEPHYEQLTLADQVFGRQTRHARIDTRRAAHLLSERCALHHYHMADIHHRHGKCQEELFLAKLNAQADGGRRLASLEKLLVQLESDKRREELAYWKDTAELRNTLFENAKEYATARDRAAILKPFGGTHELV